MAVIEAARLTIDPASGARFEAAAKRCAPLFEGAAGCLSMSLQREIENPGVYVLLVGWNSVSDHIVTFRGSPAFAEWRETVGGFFTAPPTVVHYETAFSAF